MGQRNRGPLAWRKFEDADGVRRQHSCPGLSRRRLAQRAAWRFRKSIHQRRSGL